MDATFLLAFPRLGELIFQHLENHDLVTCLGASHEWREFLLERTKLFHVRKLAAHSEYNEESWLRLLKHVSVIDIKNLASTAARTGVPGLSPVHVAAASGQVNVYKALVSSHGLHPNPSYKASGITPLHVAAGHGHLEMVCHILSQVQEKNPSADGVCCLRIADLHDVLHSTPLHSAATNGHWRVCQAITAELQDKNPANKRGTTPLHNAAEYGHLDTVKFLMSVAVDKNPRGELGYTPLHAAAFWGHFNVVEFMARMFPNDLTPAWSGDTPGLLAGRRGHWEIFDFLTEKTCEFRSSTSRLWSLG